MNMMRPDYEQTTTIRGEVAMTACARALAGQLSAGDCVLLSGTLGTGKTTLARGIVRAFCGEQTEVVSPSFMLVQEYDAVKGGEAFALYHFDLYRLEHPDELWELGLDEMLGHALLLVEWPEVAAGLWPRDRLEIYLAHAPGEADARQLHVRAWGDMVAPAQRFIAEWEAQR